MLHEDDGAMFVDKPAGLPSTGATLDDPHCMQSWLISYFRRRKIWAVHQLDADTTGVNLFVRRKALVELWATRLKAAEKAYVAFVQGVLVEDLYEVDAPLGYCERSRRRRVLSTGHNAHSTVRVLKRFNDATEVEVRIATGRTHQVRLHLEHLGHPILGERRYAADVVRRRHTRHALHAEAIRFDFGLEVKSSVPPDLERLRKALGGG